MKSVFCLLLIAALCISAAGCDYFEMTDTTPTDPQDPGETFGEILGTWSFGYYSTEDGVQSQDIELPDTKIQELRFYSDGTGYMIIANGRESFISWQVTQNHADGIGITVNAAAFPAAQRTVQMRYAAASGDEETPLLTWDVNDEYALILEKGYSYSYDAFQTRTDPIANIVGTWQHTYYYHTLTSGETMYADAAPDDPEAVLIEELRFEADGTGYIILKGKEKTPLSWQISGEEDQKCWVEVKYSSDTEAYRLAFVLDAESDHYQKLICGPVDDRHYAVLEKVRYNQEPETPLVWTDTAADIPGTWRHAYYYLHFSLMDDNKLRCLYGNNGGYLPLDGFEIQELRFEADGTGYIITMTGEKSSLLWWISWQDEDTINVEFEAGGHMSSRDSFIETFTIDSNSKIYHTLNHCVDDGYSAALEKVQSADQPEPQPEGSFLYEDNAQDVLFTWALDHYAVGAQQLEQYDADPYQISQICLLDDGTGIVQKNNGELIDFIWQIAQHTEEYLLIETAYVDLYYHIAQDNSDRHSLTFEIADGVSGVLKKYPGPTETDEDLDGKVIVDGDRYILGPYIFSAVSLTLNGQTLEGLELVASDAALVDAVIPSQVNGIPVISIGDQAFFCNDILRSVTIPQGVVNIGIDAFYCCYSLLTVKLPDTLIQISAGAFENCCFTEISIPDSVTHIGPSAFEGCTSLDRVALSQGLLHLEDRAFQGCTGLTTIHLPESLLRIGSYAFGSCDSIQELILPAGLQELGDYAFYGCPGLKEVRITTILRVDRGFTYAIGLKRVIVEDGVTSLPYFVNCGQLQEVILPDTVTTGDSIEDLPSSVRIYFLGSREQCPWVLMDQKTVTIYYYKEEEPGTRGNYWHYVDGEPVIW